jgi:hypothetical protein
VTLPVRSRSTPEVNRPSIAVAVADGSSAMPKDARRDPPWRCPAVSGRPMSDLGVDGDAFAQQRRDRSQRQVRHDVSVSRISAS